jgi:branched-chain amino acid aminotransferase
MPFVWLNNRLINSKDAKVSVFDHGFLYGDGIYETVHAYGYRIFHWPEHYRRLLQSARRIALKCPWTSRVLEQRMVQVLKANREPDASVRITIARGPGPLGLDPKLCPQPTLVLLLHPKRDVERYQREGISIGITKVRRNHPATLDPQIKSNNSLNTILAKMEGDKMGVFEAVLLNLDGFLTEGTTSNIFFVKRNQLFTPALDCGLLAGITRETVIRLAKKNGLRVHEGRYTLRDLQQADEVFLSSTTLEIAPVIRVKLAGKTRLHPIGSGHPGAVTRRIQALFRATHP